MLARKSRDSTLSHEKRHAFDACENHRLLPSAGTGDPAHRSWHPCRLQPKVAEACASRGRPAISCGLVRSRTLPLYPFQLHCRLGSAHVSHRELRPLERWMAAGLLVPLLATSDGDSRDDRARRVERARGGAQRPALDDASRAMLQLVSAQLLCMRGTDADRFSRHRRWARPALAWAPAAERRKLTRPWPRMCFLYQWVSVQTPTLSSCCTASRAECQGAVPYPRC